MKETGLFLSKERDRDREGLVGYQNWEFILSILATLKEFSCKLWKIKI